MVFTGFDVDGALDQHAALSSTIDARAAASRSMSCRGIKAQSHGQLRLETETDEIVWPDETYRIFE